MKYLEEVLKNCMNIVENTTGRGTKLHQEKNFKNIFEYLDHLKKTLNKGVYFDTNIEVGDYVKVDEIVICGKNVKLRDYAYLRGIVILGDNVNVSAEVKDSVILEGTKATHRNVCIDNSILGKNCNIGAGTQFANLRFDDKPPLVYHNNTKYNFDRRKLGAILEDDCKTGVNAILKPGGYYKKGSRIIRN